MTTRIAAPGRSDPLIIEPDDGTALEPDDEDDAGLLRLAMAVAAALVALAAAGSLLA